MRHTMFAKVHSNCLEESLVTDKNIHYMLEAQPVVNILNQLKDWVGVILALIKWRVSGLVTFTAMVAGVVAGQGTSEHANALSQLFV